MKKISSWLLVAFLCTVPAWAQDNGDPDETGLVAALGITDVSVDGNTISGQVTVENLTEEMLDADLLLTVFKVSFVEGLPVRLHQVETENLGLIWLDAVDSSETVEFSVDVTQPGTSLINLFLGGDPRPVEGTFLLLATYPATIGEDHRILPSVPAATAAVTVGDDGE
ncbi:MAG: hypothetical protein ACRD1R_19650 [Acidobacteriota bacterium]